MKKLLTILSISFLAVFLVTGSAMSYPFTFGTAGGGALQEVLNDITVAPSPTPGTSSVDVTADALLDSQDSTWSTTASGSSVATMIIELASLGPTNSFGVYDPLNPGSYVELFNGDAVAGASVTLSILADRSILVNFVDSGVDFTGTSFGYYLDSSADTNGGFWYSDSSLNADGADHMAAYQGTNTDTVQIDPYAAGLWTDNEFVLAFEDISFDSGSDGDFTDMVVMVESVMPIPEPATMLLLGTGLIGIAGLGRKKLSK